MKKINTPVRTSEVPSVRTRGYASQEGYWTEGEAYELTLRESDALKAAARSLIAIYKDTMNVVTSNEKYSDNFVFTGNKKKDRTIYEFASQEWQKDKSKSYVIDRWDLAYDGISPPKLLERNFGYLGLIAGTASVQEDYIYWLAQQDEYANIEAFGDLQSSFVKAFRRAAYECGISDNSRIVVTVQPENPRSDPGMLWANEIICRWIKRAGFEPLKTSISYMFFNRGMTQAFIEISEKLKGQLSFEIGPRGQLLDVYANVFLQQRKCFPFYGFDNYAESRALSKWKPEKVNKTRKRLSLLERTYQSQESIMLYPMWSLLMGHKALQPIMYERNQGHPNLLPTYFSPEPFAGIKHIVKRAHSCQGIGSKIVDENGTTIDSRRFEKRKEKFPYHIYQQYAEACREEKGGFRVFHMFTSDGEPAALGTRVAPAAFVGGDDTQTKFMPVLVRNGSKSDKSRHVVPKP